MMEWTALYSSARDAYRTIVPHPQDRIPITARFSLHFVLPALLLLYLAYLARRPDTFLLRSLFLPVTVLSILGTFFRFTFATNGAELDLGDGLLATLALSLIARAISFACRPEGMLKIDEEKPGIAIRPAYGDPDGAADPPGDPSTRVSCLPAWLYDSLELSLTARGIGWKFGAGVHVPKEHRPLERSAFLRATLVSVLKHYLILDACDTFLKLVPGVGSPAGGTIFRPELLIPQRYILSIAVVLVTGGAIISCFHLGYGIITLIAVGIFSSEPSAWPPVMDNPWKSDSLHIFWAKRWQQLLRETFFIYGGSIGCILAGDTGRIFGTFIGSGLVHVLPAVTLGSEFDLHAFLFFALQAPLLLLEKLWTRATGYRVKGIYGQVWTFLVLCTAGQLLVDAWCRVGLGGARIVEPSLSPFRNFFIPLLVQVVEWMGLHGWSVLLRPTC